MYAKKYKEKFFCCLLACLLMTSCQTHSPVSSPSPTPLSASSSSSPSQDPVSVAPVQTPDPVLRAQASQALEARIEEICLNRQVTGMSLAVFDSQGVFFRQSWGYAVAETGQPVQEDTIFRVASVSKSITAMLALELVDQGKLKLDEPVSSYIGIPVVNPAFPDKPVTLRHLLTHTSGLQDSAVYWDAVSRSTLAPLETVLANSFFGAPGSAYCYSNLGMGLVSGVIEGATGQRFLDYTREHVFAPMGVDAAYSYSEIVHKERVADIYSGAERTVHMPQWQGMTGKYTVLPVGQLYALGHGDLFISAGDLARLVQVMAGCPQPEEPVSLSDASRKAMQTVQYSMEPEPDAFPNEVMRGLGTQITDRLLEDRRMVGHQGNAYGSICGIFFDPVEKTGFVFLTNGASMAADTSGLYLVNMDVARAVYEAFFQYVPQDHGEASGSPGV